MELILNLIYIYIGIFSIYFFCLALRSISDRKILSMKKYAVNEQFLCVILYSHNNFEALKRTLQQLREQTYSASKFIVYVILDNCSDRSETYISETANLRILNLDDNVTVGKDQAISILLEKLRDDNTIASYIFLDTNRFIEKDFIANANIALSFNPVVSGNTVIIENNNMSFTEKIKIAYNKYQNNFVRKARSLFGLSDIVSDELLAIRKDFVEKIDALDLKNINTELKYSVLTSSLGYPCLYAPYFKSYIKLFDFNIEHPSLSYRISLFKQCLTKLLTFNVKFIEHICSLIAPSGLVAILLSLGYVFFSAKYYFLFSFIVVFTLFSMLLLGFSISLLKSELSAKEILFLFVYPIYSIGHILDNIPPYRFLKKYIFKDNNLKNDIQKYTVKVIATNGKIDIPCKLDLISENSMAKVIFTFKKKKFTSNKQIRMVEALNELVSKLNDYGFQLKICYCCEYFSSIVDGSKNMVQGECSFEFKDKIPTDTLNTILWNSCSACKPKKFVSVIDDIRHNR